MFQYRGFSDEGSEREVAERVISADGFLGVNALSGGMQGEGHSLLRGVGGKNASTGSRAEPLRVLRAEP